MARTKTLNITAKFKIYNISQHPAPVSINNRGIEGLLKAFEGEGIFFNMADCKKVVQSKPAILYNGWKLLKKEISIWDDESKAFECKKYKKTAYPLGGEHRIINYILESPELKVNLHDYSSEKPFDCIKNQIMAEGGYETNIFRGRVSRVQMHFPIGIYSIPREVDAGVSAHIICRIPGNDLIEKASSIISKYYNPPKRIFLNVPYSESSRILFKKITSENAKKQWLRDLDKLRKTSEIL